MKVTVADLRILVFEEQHSMDRAEGLAWARKADAFGTLSRLFSRPRDEDFDLAYKERRFQPFWHVVCSAHYAYERKGQYQIPLKGAEIKSVTIEGTDHEVTGTSLTLSGVEHCGESARVEFYMDALTGNKDASLADYSTFSTTDATLEDLGSMTTEGIIVVPPQIGSTGVVREAVRGLVKQVVADEIVEESLEVEHIDLYFRPVYAFEYRWLSREREATMEYDALTGKFSTDGKTYQEFAEKSVEADTIASLDADTVSQLVPGGQLAVPSAAPQR